MKKNIITLCFCLLVTSLTAQEKVAILPFTGGSGDEGNAIAQILKTEFAELGSFQIASNTQAMDKVLEDKNIQKIGITGGDAIVRLGKNTNADYVVYGHIQTLGNKKILLTTIVHVKTFQQVAGDYYKYTDFTEVINYIPTLAEKLESKTKTDYLSLPTLVILPFGGIAKEKATRVKGFFSIFSSSKANEVTSELLEQLLTIEIINRGKYGVISITSTIENIMEEQNIQIKDLADSRVATKLGKEVNVQYVLSGTVSPLVDDSLIDVVIIEVLSLAQEAGAYIRYKTIEEGIELMPELSSELTGVLSNKTTLSLSLEDAIALYEGEDYIYTIKQLVAKDINATDTTDANHYNYTLLMYASEYGYTEIVKSLIEAGANLEAKSQFWDSTALMRASKYGHLEIVKALIEAEANLEAKNRYGETALIYASEYGQTEIVKTLIEAGANLEVKSNGGWTAVMRAAEEGYTEIVKALLEAGKDLDTIADMWASALSDAASEGHTELIKTLIKAGADVNAKKKYGSTALFSAAASGHIETVQVLIEAGADVNIPSTSTGSYDSPALLLASEYGYTEIVKLLIEAGADVNAKGQFGDWTALMRAAKEKHTEIVQVLIEAGADLDAVNSQGEAALSWANYKWHTNIINLLKEAGAGINVKTIVNQNDTFFIFIISVWVLGGAVVFGIYYSLYKQTIEKEGSVKSTSFIIRASLILGWVNMLIGVGAITFFGIFYNFSFLIILCVVPTSIGTIAISFFEYKKKLIAGESFIFILLINITACISINYFMALLFSM